MDIASTAEHLNANAGFLWQWAVEFLPKLGSAILLLIVGYILAGWTGRAARRMSEKSGQADKTIAPIIQAFARYAVLIVFLVAVLAQLGIQTASILAALGAAGLAIGLALQGTLSNIAAGLMLLWLRPFQVDDFIECSAANGTVNEIGLFCTKITTWDGIFIFVPNSELWNKPLTNYTRNPTRLVLLEIGVDYAADIETARGVLLDVANANPSVLKDPAPQVVPLSLGDSSVNLQMRAWANRPEFWATKWELTVASKAALEKAGIDIPFPQRVVHLEQAASAS